MRQSIFLAFATLLLFNSPGCGAKSDTGIVHGKVMLDGKPLTSGTVMTLPPAGRGAAGVIQDGDFDLKTNGKEGAVAGTHKVGVSANEQPQGAGPEAPAGKSLIPDKYTNPNSSGLTIDVKA